MKKQTLASIIQYIDPTLCRHEPTDSGHKIVADPAFNDGISLIKIPITDVTYGDLIFIDATVENRTGAFGQCYTGVSFYRNGKEFIRPHRGNIYQGQCQFYAAGMREYLYKFVVPDGVDQIEVFIRCQNGGQLLIKRLEILTGSSPHPALLPLDQGVKFVAHLGMIGYAPHNTMPAFYLAKRAGYRECVTNTNFTKDGALVALHDNTIDATSNGTGCIHEMTLAEAQRYDYGSYFNEFYKNTPIPLLDDVLKFMTKSGMRPVLRLSSEFTDANHQYLIKIYDLVKKNGLLGRCTAKAFKKEVLDDLAKIAGDRLRYGFCCSGFDMADVQWLKSLGPDVYFDVSHSKLNADMVALALANDVAVESYIVNDFEKIVRFTEMGVTGFTTDFFPLDGCIY